MNNRSTPMEAGGRTSQKMIRDPRFIKFIQILSRVVTLLFVLALFWVIFQSVINGNPLPLWAWLGMVVLLAAAIGLIVMVVIYKGVTEQVGPFDYRPSGHVTGQLQNETKHLEIGEATALRADIKMTQGVLELIGGTAAAMDADFTYDDADWKQPAVDYTVDATGQGNLVVHQRATHRPAMRQGRSEWAIRLNQHLPTNLKVNFGAGKADLRLSDLNLSRLRVESGVGELDLDLGDEWDHSLKAFIKAGIGHTSLRLPQSVGVRVQSTVGFGSVNANGLVWDGQAYTNDLYGQAAIALDITIEGGMGKISLEQSG